MRCSWLLAVHVIVRTEGMRTLLRPSVVLHCRAAVLHHALANGTPALQLHAFTHDSKSHVPPVWMTE